jgi:uncharacterized protein YehS (DUF1456 family)
MTNNDVLRMVRYALELHNPAVLELFALSNIQLPLVDLDAMLRNDDDAGYVAMSDGLLGAMLDGLVVKHRGRREAVVGETGQAPAPQAALTNNRILRALRIALELKDTDVLDILEKGGLVVSKAELAALFRREGHRNYQPCGDQILRNFLRGLAIWYRGAPTV